MVVESTEGIVFVDFVENIVDIVVKKIKIDS